jgi:hypothetical protein
MLPIGRVDVQGALPEGFADIQLRILILSNQRIMSSLCVLFSPISDLNTRAVSSNLDSLSPGYRPLLLMPMRLLSLCT